MALPSELPVTCCSHKRVISPPRVGDLGRNFLAGDINRSYPAPRSTLHTSHLISTPLNIGRVFFFPVRPFLSSRTLNYVFKERSASPAVSFPGIPVFRDGVRYLRFRDSGCTTRFHSILGGMNKRSMRGLREVPEKAGPRADSEERGFA